ncbi:THUMP domain-containing protein 1-like protein [Cucurbita argyrosperma subsp. argyrosperma]|uniref:THUMP domain-containing protein 1 homolog n=1 Tax=Cucurbita pepo subsp. pepo TaxID=3664 RepID=UPI000C9D4885|nr:THUMP domain-containing protein 1 homolog [Cucurbita pepo subsp. pepo]KAG7022095.1 THUMP domain-containing protein 1-like protein [Cucurbita argyrosperma subsp. argyrosperma]
MAAENKPSTAGKKRKQRYRPNNKPVKKKGHYPLRPGVQGFFITCDGGRERQASIEAINVIDSFFDEFVHGKGSGVKLTELADKPLNKKIKFSDSESSGSDDDDDGEEEEEEVGDENEDENKEVPEEESKSKSPKEQNDPCNENKTTDVPDTHQGDIVATESRTEEKSNDNEKDIKCPEVPSEEVEEPPKKKHCIEADASKSIVKEKEKSIDQLIEAELQELGDKSKRRFFNLDSGCNGVVFIQMRKNDGEPGPEAVVQHMMTSIASTRKHISRFILRVLPVEVACYASVEEISRAIKPLIEKNFPVESQSPKKFAVLYEARSNTGIDRATIINTVAKAVPEPHKVDLNNPEKTIVVEIVKTICLIGVVEKYKELSKYNLRQLTSRKQ